MGTKPKDPGPTPTQKKLQAAQLKDLQRLESSEKQRSTASRRARSGRSSLLSGEARGIKTGRDRKMKGGDGIVDPLTPHMQRPEFGILLGAFGGAEKLANPKRKKSLLDQA